MVRYEWKKLRHNPIPIIVMVVYILIKLSILSIHAPEYQYDAYDAVRDQMYGEMNLSEIAEHIDADLEAAEAALAYDMSGRYAKGEIGIEEYRSWTNNTEARYAKAGALSNIQVRVRELKKIQMKYEKAVAAENPKMSDDAFWIARWKEIDLIDESSWAAIKQMESVSLVAYIIILLIVPVYTELWASRMAVIARTSGEGWRISLKAKKKIVGICLAILWMIECVINYGLPLILWGDGQLDVAIQSIKHFSEVILPLSAGGYIVFSCLLQLVGIVMMATLAYGLCLFLRSTYGSVCVLAIGYLALFTLAPWRATVDKLFAPSTFIILNPEPVNVIAIGVGYLLTTGMMLCLGKQITEKYIIVENKVK